MRRPAATAEAIQYAITELNDFGNDVTVRAIREKIGGGSYTTIQKQLKKIRGPRLVPVEVASCLLKRVRQQTAMIDHANCTINLLRQILDKRLFDEVVVLDDELMSSHEIL